MTSNRTALRELLRPRRKLVTSLGLVSALGGVLEAVLLVIVARAALGVADGDETVEIWGRELSRVDVLVVGTVLAVTRFACAVLASQLTGKLVEATARAFRDDLATAYLRATWNAQHRQRSGQLQDLLTTFSQEGVQLMTALARALGAAASLFALVAAALVLDVGASLVLIVAITILGLALRPLRRRLRGAAAAASDSGIEFAAQLSETAQMGLESHVFGVQDASERRIRGRVDEYAEDTGRLAFLNTLLPGAYAFLAYLALLAALGAVAAVGSSELDALGSVMIVMLRSLSYGQMLQAASASVLSRLPFVERHSAEVAFFRDHERRRDGVAVRSIEVLEAQHATFAYDDVQEVLHDVSFRLGHREILGVVGPSGSGKSTLVQLLLGLRQPTHGQILADGADISTLAPADWVRLVTFVPQSSNLVAGTIADNIRFFRDGVSDEMVVDAARRAHLHADVVAMSDGYERRVGSSGADLSGGQRQRLAIARALVERPDVIILDEPTSSLDPRSEELIRESLRELSSTASVMIIAHRMSTLAICDRIMVIEDGRVSAIDTPDALERSNDYVRSALVLGRLT